MAETRLTTPWSTLTLDLFPPDRRSSLRAWDASDEFILEQLNQEEKPEAPVLLVNDDLGALHCALSPLECYHMQDSALALDGVRQNLKQNGFTDSTVKNLLFNHEDGPETFSWVIIKIPKTLSLLEYQLSLIRPLCTAETRILAGAMTRHIHKSTLELFEAWIGSTTTSLAKKKARLIFPVLDPSLKIPEYTPLSTYSCEEISFPLKNLPNLFSRDRLDKATALLVDFMGLKNNEENLHLADFGCGNGIIGIYGAMQAQTAKVTALDDSLLAVESTNLNCESRELQSKMDVVHGYRLNSLNGPFDKIFSNPPFHQGHKIDMTPTLQFFNDALEMLKEEGELRIVCNRHLGYHSHLKKIFGNCSTLAEREGFQILRAIKKSKPE